ncbi:hypothetical protein B0H11DRAFT_2282262 [Mycena galericulata]|nr:hypothetical protein B0H11DRAFT_2282262 [Mycena galericulata]
MSLPDTSNSLTAEQKAHFPMHGFVHLRQCFSPEAAAAFSSTLWTRLGMSPTDKSTWNAERINMPAHTSVPISEFAPKAWRALCELGGGEDKDVDGWHVDGDFRHFLDSPEQALLVIPLFSDIAPGGGGTAICTDGIGVIAKHLYDNPNGVTPWTHDRARASDASFHEMTGAVGDVYLLHPLMLHSASKNVTGALRVITNPPVTMKMPFQFNVAMGREFSLVEQKTLRELGFPAGLDDWKIQGERERIVPMRLKDEEVMKAREQERLAGVNT